MIVAEDVAKQLGEKETAEHIMGVMVRPALLLFSSFSRSSVGADVKLVGTRRSRVTSLRGSRVFQRTDRRTSSTANPSRSSPLPAQPSFSFLSFSPALSSPHLVCLFPHFANTL